MRLLSGCHFYILRFYNLLLFYSSLCYCMCCFIDRNCPYPIKGEKGNYINITNLLNSFSFICLHITFYSLNLKVVLNDIEKELNIPTTHYHSLLVTYRARSGPLGYSFITLQIHQISLALLKLFLSG